MIKLIKCPQCGMLVKVTEIIWLDYEKQICDCCFDCENLVRMLTPQWYEKLIDEEVEF